MSVVGQSERATQNRVLNFFTNKTGRLQFRDLGNWSNRPGNSNIEQELLTQYLEQAGYTKAQIDAALQKLTTEATNKNRSLYENNKIVYNLLRFGISVTTEPGKPSEQVHLINWQKPEENDFAIAEEVTLNGDNERRPDLVIYVNGIALAVIELKNSRVGVGEGIRQLISNQEPNFNEWFFSTVQFLFAGNDSEGLRYGTIKTPAKFYLQWKENEQDNDGYKLDKYLLKMCEKQRFLELIHDFVLFDGGRKKLPRVHQYFGIKAAQEFVRRKRGGIIWHTQGSGKSILMVLLAKWILENNPAARVAIITDRDELDKQIDRVFTAAGERIVRSASGADLAKQLSKPSPRLLASLIHKFGRIDVVDKLTDRQFAEYLAQLRAQPSQTVGEIYVFVDECHRTQGGRLHKLMKALLPNAVFVGFTGTPLLKKDRQTTLEVFGEYIHTYKFSEAVDDEVVLDLIYEARDIDQLLGSEQRIDEWFEAKTRGLNDWQKDELKKRWGTLQKVLSSRSRMEVIIEDIIHDFSCKPRLSSERGNAILVASSIYEACRYYQLLQSTPFKAKCAVITSYHPQASDISKATTGDDTRTQEQSVYETYTELLKHVAAKPGMTQTETYEEWAKELFIKEPPNMKLLVVVDKLLTGFDAPSCTNLYIDKSMQDHGLFQAICRTNRLDGDDKQYGYIVDYKDLFKKVENAIAVYTSELEESTDSVSSDVLLKDRITTAKERLDTAIEALALTCEPIEPPKTELQCIQYFCGNTEIPSDLAEREIHRVALYKGTAALLRGYANLADSMAEAGYSSERIAEIKDLLEYYAALRDTIRNAAGETLDLKPYEADMRHLIDTYIKADEPRKVSSFDNLGLLDLIVKTGIGQAIAQRLGGLKGNEGAIAETIENNVRKTIIRKQLSDPAFYEKMSELLDEVIRDRRSKAIKYEEYLRRMADIIKTMGSGRTSDTPEALSSPGKRAIYNRLKQLYAAKSGTDHAGNQTPPVDGFTGSGTDPVVCLAVAIHETVQKERPDGWRDVQAKEAIVKRAIHKHVKELERVEAIFLVVKAQGEY